MSKIKWNYKSISALIFLILIALLFTYILVSQIVYKHQRDYYQSQMLTFCEIALKQEQIILYMNPDLPIKKLPEDCNTWLIGWFG